MRVTAPAALAVVLILAASCVVYAASARSSATKRLRNAIKVSGNIAVPLHPGDRRPLKLSVTNRKKFPVWITGLKIYLVVDKPHSGAGCSGTRDFTVTQLTKRAFPIKLPAARKSSKKRARRRLRISPTLTMKNLSSVNQDACKGAKIKIVYVSRVTKPRTNARSVKSSGSVISE